MAFAAALTALMLAPIVAREGIAAIGATDVLYVLVAASFTVSGAIASTRRPDSRIGLLMTCFAIVWAADFLMLQATSALVFTLGGVVLNLVYLVYAVILLSFPSGRLASAAGERLVVGSVLFAALPMELVRLLFFEPASGPGNVLQVSPRPETAEAISTAQRVLFIAAIAALLAILIKRWLDATGPRRRALAPALAGTPLFVLAGIVAVNGTVPDALWRPLLVAFMAAPIALLAFLLQARLARSAVADLLVELGGDPAPAAVRDAFARALRDPSLQLAYWLPEYDAYADVDGNPVDVSAAAGRATTLIDRKGRHVAAMLHDPYLREEPELLDAVGSAAGLALENARLHAELLARLDDLQKSRVRILEAAQDERRRLERNLHDGAQQRLVALAMELRLLERRFEHDPEAKRRLDEARGELMGSLNELRQLARGLHPAVVTVHGLAVALEGLAARAAVPVALDVELEPRLPEAYEVAAYYLVAESLTNVAKYAAASEAAVAVRRSAGALIVEVSDDGVGGADSEAGSGIRGMADRVEALGGRLRVWSPQGGGTRIRAELPLDDRAAAARVAPSGAGVEEAADR